MASGFYISNELVAAAFSAAFERRVVTREEYEERKYEPEFALVETLDTAKVAELSYEPAFGKFGDVYGESGEKITAYVRTITGRTFELEIGRDSYVEEVKHVLEETKGEVITDPYRFILLFNGKKMDEGRRISEYGVVDGSTLEFSVDLRASGPTPVLVLDDSVRDPVYDYDFTDMEDDGTEYYRGGHRYHRPYGWNRIALNVDGRYEDGTWLGEGGVRMESSSGEWPVSYHGTKHDFTNSIAMQGYLLSKGKRFAYGKGIYSSPDIDEAAGYAQPFTHDGQHYQVVFQNRVSPNGLETFGTYWLQPDEKLIRPYALCIRKWDM